MLNKKNKHIYFIQMESINQSIMREKGAFTYHLTLLQIQYFEECV